MKDEGNQSVTSCNQLKLKSHKDGKRYLTDVANTEQLLRIIQSIPSPKAEPFKAWLAMAGRECIEETIDPELVLTMLAEATKTEISKAVKPATFSENQKVAQKGFSL